MNVTNEFLSNLILLLPGLLASILYNTLRHRRVSSPMVFIFEAAIFTGVIYLLANLVSYCTGWNSIVTIDTTAKSGSIIAFSPNWGFIILSICLSIIISGIWSWIAQRDYHTWIFRSLKCTDLTSKETAWEDVFSREDRYVIVHRKGGNKIYGWPEFSSVSSEKREIYISEPVFIKGGKYEDTPSVGFLIVLEDGDMVEFTNKLK